MRAPIHAILVVVIAVTGCSSIKPGDPYGRHIPRNPDWTLKSGNPDPEGLICFDCIYVNDFYDPRIAELAVRRFWPTGQYMSKLTDQPLDPKVPDSFTNAAVGYYVVKNGEITCESFGPINFGQYGISKGFIDTDGSIVLLSHGPRGGRQVKYPEPRRFAPVRVEGLTLEPDW